MKRRRWHRFVVLADVPANGVLVEGFTRSRHRAERVVQQLRMFSGGLIRYGYAPIDEAQVRLPHLFEPKREQS